MTFSGVNKCLDPSICDLKVTPSSFILRTPDKEYTWYPPLSVKIGLSQPLNLCKPPACCMVSKPGLKYK